jgi:ABC-type multidrug transport system ATPase subunit/pSer/pThr/pTyr-binding forkhead associated (FHA) protein/ABC-type multidrug transport system permease subunit
MEGGMADELTHLCPNCKQPQPAGRVRCENCGAQFTIAFSADDGSALLRVLPDRGTPFMVALDRKVMHIGSDPRQEVSIRSVGVAPHMAQIVQEGGQYRFADLTGAPGQVMVNDQPANGGLLQDGDTIRLQDGSGRGVTLIFLNVARESRGEAEPKTWPLDHFPFAIGRSPESDLPLEALAVSWTQAQIVEQDGAHVLHDLNSTNGTFVNDVRLDRPQRLQMDDVIRIDRTLLVYKGDSLRRLAATQRYTLQAARLSMTYHTGLRRRRALTTLRDVSFTIEPNEFVAIIGGSGSGKSTLLRALNGANPATSGQVLVNGEDLYANYDRYQPMIGYVPQSDIVQNKLTVYQSLVFDQRIHSPYEPAVAREQRIMQVLKSLDLLEVRDRLVGNLSGGQKKRVSTAIEIIDEPYLLFMDEPSSGLDPGLDRTMMEMLRRVANRGNIVVVVTHTTLNIDMCDKLAVMVRGQLVYFGPPQEALRFFNVQDYSEIYNRVLQTPRIIPGYSASLDEAVSLWVARFGQTEQYAHYVKRPDDPPSHMTLSIKRGRGGEWLRQTRTLAERTLTVALRDLRTLIALLVVLPLVGLFLGLISLDPVDGGRGKMLIDRFEDERDWLTFIDAIPLADISVPAEVAEDAPSSNAKSVGTFAPANDAQRLLFMLALSVALLGMFATAYAIVEEKSLFLRERMTNLQVGPYVLSKVVVYGGFALLSCLLAQLTLALGVELPGRGLITWGPLEIFITLALTALAGVCLGLLVSALNRSVNAVTYMVLAVLFVQILFPGVLFAMDGALEVPSRLTVTRWALEALGGTVDMQARDAEGHFVIETVPINPRTGDPLPGAPLARQAYRTPSSLSVSYAASATDLWIRWGALLGFSALFLIAAWIVLHRDETF